MIIPLLLLVGAANAVNLTVVDGNCSSWSFSGSTATCVGTTPPVPPDPPIPPTPPSGMTGCVNQGMATMTAQAINIPWGQSAQFFSKSYAPFGGAVWVFSIAVPAGQPPTGNAGRFTVSEYQGPGTSRQMSVSTSACDFNSATALNVSEMGQTVETYFGVGAPSSFWAGMASGQTYYISIRNWGQAWPNPPGPSCPGNCPALLSVQPPQ